MNKAPDWAIALRSTSYQLITAGECAEEEVEYSTVARARTVEGRTV
jgi:hypothetical protein